MDVDTDTDNESTFNQIDDPIKVPYNKCRNAKGMYNVFYKYKMTKIV